MNTLRKDAVILYLKLLYLIWLTTKEIITLITTDEKYEHEKKLCNY